MAKPRVFVSSTYYDLKYVRERLERFISAYCFEPILFESDEVFFNPNTPLDESCYKEVENCHMMILIVGGRYGSLASEQKEKYEEQYISITRKEYDTARRKGIPVMVFVEQNVFAEYKTYIANQKKMPDGFKYAFVDDARIFEFISNLEQGAIKIFSKIDDIEHYVSHQIAGMLLSYLKDLQDKKSNIEIKNAVDEIKVVSQSMQEMINSIAEKIFESEKGKYEKLLEQQQKDLIDFFFTIFRQNFKIDDMGLNEDEAIKAVDNICNILKQTILEINRLDTITYEDNHKRTRRAYSIKALLEAQKTCKKELTMRYPSMKIEIDILKLRNPLLQVLNKIKDNSTLQLYFDQQLKQMIEWEINRYLLRMRILSQTMDISPEDE